MIVTLITILVCAILFVAARAWWRSYLNPVALGTLVWLPGLIMVNWSPFFLDPRYIYFNRPVTPLIYIALGAAFFSFWAGCAIVKTLSSPDSFALRPGRIRVNTDDRRLFALFAAGLLLFLYSYLRSGLTNLSNLDTREVAEARVSLHLGWLSFLEFFLDIGAIGFFARFLETGKKYLAIPMVIALVCYALTLQKSPVVQLLGACLVLAALHPQASRYLFWRTALHRIVMIALPIVLIAVMIVMNTARGIAVVQMTAASSPIIEQIYIYSGGSAIMNLATTIEGYLPSGDPTLGLYLARPLTWYLVDRSQFVAGAYVEGINASTFLMYAWVDFRWLGFVVTPFLTGVAVMVFLRASLRGGLFQTLLAVTAARTVIFSDATDVVFDQATWIFLGVGGVAHLLTKRYRSVALQRPQVPPAEQAQKRIPGQAAG
jgi:hypothetical protein